MQPCVCFTRLLGGKPPVTTWGDSNAEFWCSLLLLALMNCWKKSISRWFETQQRLWGVTLMAWSDYKHQIVLWIAAQMFIRYAWLLGLWQLRGTSYMYCSYLSHHGALHWNQYNPRLKSFIIKSHIVWYKWPPPSMTSIYPLDVMHGLCPYRFNMPTPPLFLANYSLIYGCYQSSAHDDVIKWKHFRLTGHLCREFTGPRWIPPTKASDAELWCFLWSASE